MASFGVQFLNFAEDTKFLPAQPFTGGCKRPSVDFPARKVHTVLFLGFPLTRSADQNKCDCAPLGLLSQDYTFLFRFPSETLQVQTISFRRVIKGGECTPGGVGGSGAGRRPGVRSGESGRHGGWPRSYNNTQSIGGFPAAPPPTHPPPASYPWLPRISGVLAILCLSLRC